MPFFAISWYAKKRSEGNDENFALAGRKLSAPLIGVTIIGLVWAAHLPSATLTCLPCRSQYRLVHYRHVIVHCYRHVSGEKTCREQNITTITELIERHHTTGAVVLGVLQIVISGNYQSAVHCWWQHPACYSADIFDFQSGMIVSVQFIGITFIGGMWSASMSNVLNIVLIYGGSVLLFIQFGKIGSLTLAASLPTKCPLVQLTEGVALWWPNLRWIVTLVTVNLPAKHSANLLGAKDAATAKKGSVIGCF